MDGWTCAYAAAHHGVGSYRLPYNDDDKQSTQGRRNLDVVL